MHKEHESAPESIARMTLPDRWNLEHTIAFAVKLGKRVTAYRTEQGLGTRRSHEKGCAHLGIGADARLLPPHPTMSATKTAACLSEIGTAEMRTVLFNFSGS